MTFDPRHQPTSAARNIGVPTTIGGGFVPATPVGPSYTSLCGPKGSYANLSATVVTTGDPTHVSLSVQTFPAEYGGPCATQSGGPLPPTSLPQVPAPYAQLPRLQLPAGSEIIGYSGKRG